MNFDNSLTLSDIATTLMSVCEEDNSIIFTAELKVDRLATAKETEKSLLTFEDMLKISRSPDEFSAKLKYFADNGARIEEATRGQSDNPFWFSARKHCITASKAHDVVTRMNTYQKKDGEADLTSIMEKVFGKPVLNMEIPALKYGREKETEAVATFFSAFSKEHKNAKLLGCGIFLCKDMPFVGGSPDGIVVCDCCGKSCLEVKCPFSISNTSPTDPGVTLTYLKLNEDGKIMTNRSHKYYTQCQVQMAATEINQCLDFTWQFFRKTVF